jgi:hypothetical protein
MSSLEPNCIEEMMPSARRLAISVARHWPGVDRDEIIAIAYEQLVILDGQHDPTLAPYAQFVIQRLRWRITDQLRAMSHSRRGRDPRRHGGLGVTAVISIEALPADLVDHVSAFSAEDAYDEPSGLAEAAAEAFADRRARDQQILIEVIDVRAETRAAIADRNGVTDTRITQILSAYRSDVARRWAEKSAA